MREILFRGKCFNTEEWVEGYLGIEVPDELVIQQFSYDEYFKSNCIDQYSVKPETVGQYTGLTDKNGTKIFEGDIVRFIDIDFDGSERKAVGVIAWNRKAANFDIVKGTYRLDFHYPVFEEIEVIGNIYDNPELVGGNK